MKQNTGTARLSSQNGGRGYFAVVELEADIRDGEQSLTIEFVAQNASRWKEAAIVGVRNAWKQVPSKFTAKSQVNVIITKVDWQPGDTTDIVVVYVAALAVFDMFDVSPRQRPEFVESFGCFLFAK